MRNIRDTIAIKCFDLYRFNNTIGYDRIRYKFQVSMDLSILKQQT